jgi:hypothetical protein
MPLPQSTAANANSTFFPADNLFPQYFHNNQEVPGDPFSQGFLGNEWDMSAMGTGTGAGTGMTPMSEGSWNQMLESINLGWDSLGPPHGGTG